MRVLDFIRNQVENFFYTHPSSCEVETSCPPQTFFQRFFGGDTGKCVVTKFANECPKQLDYSRVAIGALGLVSAKRIANLGILTLQGSYFVITSLPTVVRYTYLTTMGLLALGLVVGLQRSRTQTNY